MLSFVKRTVYIAEFRSLRSLSALRSFSSVTTKCDALVLGCGIGGASMSYQLSKLHNLNVICLEKESSPGNHSTGKAFGIFAESNARTIQTKLMTAASRAFFESPDQQCIDDYIVQNFEYDILDRTGLLAISSPNEYPFLYENFGPEENIKFNQNIQVLTQKDAIKMVPFLNTDELAPYAIYEPNAANFNTGLVYEHFLVGGNNVGVQFYFNQSAMEMNKTNSGNWEILSYNAENNNIDRFEAGLLINCSGQWADDTAIKAGIKPINLVTHKRNVIVFTYYKDLENNPKRQKHEYLYNRLIEGQTPWIGWISSHSTDIFHSSFQGTNGIFLYDKLLINGKENKENHANEDELETVLHKITKHTTLKVEKMASKSAGIKCSVQQDKNMVIGPCLEDKSFIWCAALSSYGIQTAPAYSEITSYLAVNRDLPHKYIDLGLDINQLLPARLKPIGPIPT